MCDHANDPGGREEAMTVIERDATGKPIVWCDPCLAPLITALNNAGSATIASCCGHGGAFGWVALQDGRVIVIYPNHEANLAVNDPALLASMRSAGEFATGGCAMSGGFITIPEHLTKRNELEPSIRKLLVDEARAENQRREGQNVSERRQAAARARGFVGQEEEQR